MLAVRNRRSIRKLTFHLEATAKLLILLRWNSALFSKRGLKSLNNQTDFDSAIRRFDLPPQLFDIARQSHFVPALIQALFCCPIELLYPLFLHLSRHEIRRANQLVQVDYVLVVD